MPPRPSLTLRVEASVSRPRSARSIWDFMPRMAGTTRSSMPGRYTVAAAHGQARLAPVAVERRAESRARLGQRIGRRLRQARVGEPRQLLGGHGEIGVAEQIAGADAQELAVFEAPQRVHARLARREGPHG